MPGTSYRKTESFLRDRYEASAGHIEQLGVGGWSDAFSFVLGEEKYVIRWSLLIENFERDALAASFSREDLPIPEVVEIGRHDETFFAITRFVDGAFLESLPARDLDETMPSLLQTLRALKEVDVSRWPGYGIWDSAGNGSHYSWKAFLLDDKNASHGSLVQGWRAEFDGSPVDTGLYERLWSQFGMLVEQCPEEKSLIHSDLINRNVLVGDGQIRAVLDWGSSLCGDSLYDVAWFMFYEPWYPDFGEIDLIQRILDDYCSHTGTSRANLEMRLLCYRLHIGLDSIAYNASRRDWDHAREAADYTAQIASDNGLSV